MIEMYNYFITSTIAFMNVNKVKISLRMIVIKQNIVAQLQSGT